MPIDTFVYLLSSTFALRYYFAPVLLAEHQEKVTLLSKETLCRGLLFVDHKNSRDSLSATFVAYL